MRKLDLKLISWYLKHLQDNNGPPNHRDGVWKECIQSARSVNLFGNFRAMMMWRAEDELVMISLHFLWSSTSWSRYYLHRYLGILRALVDYQGNKQFLATRTFLSFEVWLSEEKGELGSFFFPHSKPDQKHREVKRVGTYRSKTPISRYQM